MRRYNREDIHDKPHASVLAILVAVKIDTGLYHPITAAFRPYNPAAPNTAFLLSCETYAGILDATPTSSTNSLISPSTTSTHPTPSNLVKSEKDTVGNSPTIPPILRARPIATWSSFRATFGPCASSPARASRRTSSSSYPTTSVRPTTSTTFAAQSGPTSVQAKPASIGSTANSPWTPSPESPYLCFHHPRPATRRRNAPARPRAHPQRCC